MLRCGGRGASTARSTSACRRWSNAPPSCASTPAGASADPNSRHIPLLAAHCHAASYMRLRIQSLIVQCTFSWPCESRCCRARLDIRCSPTRWQEQPTAELLHAVAAATEGCAGADLTALCAAAVHAAVRRAAPALLEQLDRRIAAPTLDGAAPPAPAAGVVGGWDFGQLPCPAEQPTTQMQRSALEPVSNDHDVDAGSRHDVMKGGTCGQQSTMPAAEGDHGRADSHLLDLVQARVHYLDTCAKCYLMEGGPEFQSSVAERVSQCKQQ